MFGNRIVNTMSPGGIRRGLIWQSSQAGEHKKQNRNFVVDPYTYAYGSITAIDPKTGKNIYFPSGTYVDSDDTVCELAGIRPSYSSQLIPITYPNFEYATTIGQKDGVDYLETLADQLAVRFDVDLYVYPNVMPMGNNPYSVDEDMYQVSDYHKVDVQNFHNVSQIFSNKSAGNKGYNIKTPGNSGSNIASYRKPMCGTPSMPMRIKGTFVYCDYAYAVAGDLNSSSAIARGNIIDFQSPTTYFSNILAGISYPDMNEFEGSSINTPNQGGYYDYYPNIMVYYDISGTRYDTTSSSTSNSQEWAMTKGIIKESYAGQGIPHHQFFFSPIVYPHSVYQNGTDAYCVIGSDHGTSYDETNFLHHEMPAFMSPIFNMPRANLVYSENLKYTASPDALTYTASLHPRLRPLTWSGGSYSHASGASFWNNTDLPFKPSTNYADPKSILMPYGVDIGSENVLTNSMIEFVIDQYNAQRWNNEGIVQPKLNKGDKWIMAVNPEIARHSFGVRTTPNSGSGGSTSGRYKYCGFKGYVSFFEMNV